MEVQEQIARLQIKMREIQQQCSGWLRCQDGSYEMALDEAGYFRLLKELEQLQKPIG